MNNSHKLISISSIGNHTVTDNNLISISNNIIAYSLQGRLILLNTVCNTIISNTFLSESMIKCISLLHTYPNTLLIICENSETFTYNHSNTVLSSFGKIPNINNVYNISLNKNETLLALSVHTICNNNMLVESQNDALCIININITTSTFGNVIYLKQSLNNFSLFDNNNNIFSFHKIHDATVCTKYSVNNTNVSVCDVENVAMKADVIRVKQDCKRNILLQCNNRCIYVYNTSTENVTKVFHIEGKGALGEICVVDNEMFISNKSGQLIKVNIETDNVNIDLNTQPYLSSDVIKGSNWGVHVVKLSSCTITLIVNENGMFCLNNDSSIKWKRMNDLSLSGCGISFIPNTSTFIYGDLAGNIIVSNKNTNTMNTITLPDNDMIRCISESFIKEPNFIVYIGTMSGRIYSLTIQPDNYSQPLINTIATINNTVTCIHFYNPYLITSDICGYIHIYNTQYELIYKYIAHEPLLTNNNMLFGSLHIQAEIWGFCSYINTALPKTMSDSMFIATCSEDQSLRIWEVSPMKSQSILIKQVKDHVLAVTCVDWNTMYNGEEIVITCSDDKTFNVYTALNGFERLYKVDVSLNIYGFFTLTYISLSKKGNSKFVIISTQVGYLIVYSLEHKKIVFNEKVHYGGIEGILYYDNEYISTLGNDCIINNYVINNYI